jgi:PGF-CTERM protein
MSAGRGGRRLLLAGTVALLVVLAGCSALDDLGGGLPDAAGGGADGTAAPGGAGEATLAAVTDGGTADGNRSFTVSVESRVSDGAGALVQRQTVRVGADGRVYADTFRRTTDGNETTLRTQYYSVDETTFVRHGVPSLRTASYERVHREEFGATSPPALGEQFAFDHERTDDGGHRFTADSVDQLRERPAEGEVTNVSVVVRVDESGVLRRLTYDLTLETADGERLTYHTEREVSAVGETTVPAPEWLPTARERTAPLEGVEAPTTAAPTEGGAGGEGGDGGSLASVSVADLRGDTPVGRVASVDVVNASSGSYTTLRHGPYQHDGRLYAVVLGSEGYEEDVTLHSALYAFDGSLTPAWRFELPPDREPVGEPTFAGETAYLVGMNGTGPDAPNRYTLYAVDLETGEQRWARSLGSVRTAALKTASREYPERPFPRFVRDGGVVVGDGTVYAYEVAAEPQTLVALDAETGETRWSFDGAVPGASYHDGRVYVGARGPAGNGTYALDAATGAVEWTNLASELPYPGFVSVADASGVYVRSVPDDTGLVEIRGLERATGETRWTTGDRSRLALIGSRPADETLFLRLGAQTVYSIDAATGEFGWLARGEQTANVRWRATAGERRVYVGSNGDVRAIDPAEYDDMATERVGFWDASRTSNALGTNDISTVREVDGVTYTVDDVGTVVAFDTRDGTLLYEEQFSYADVVGVTAVEGRAYVALRSGQLYALGPQAEPSTASTAATAANGNGRATTAAGTAGAGPGFGAGLALAALLVVGGLARRRRWSR